MADSSTAGSEVSSHFVFDEESKTLTVRHGYTLHVGNVDTVQDQEECEEMEVDAYIEPIKKAGAIKADPRILQLLQKVPPDCHNPGKWKVNQQLCSELVSLFQEQGAALTKVRFDSVHFFVSVKLGPDHDAFLQACRDGTLSRGLTKILVTPELEKEVGVKLGVRLEVKETSNTNNVSALAGRMTNLMDIKLNKIGDAVGDDENLAALGLLLGFAQTKVDMFLATNRVDGKVSAKGTKNMLSAWSKKTRGENQVKELSDALADVELGYIAEKYLQRFSRDTLRGRVDVTGM
ncbi:uncharacterized protein LOC105445475 [Strongylocentrotus purpuratus]|uniref:Uncharacterized protein n=1 Tax=Strongylocentrotus purpuratus TaxID=7668 RepID=A0A7M7N9Y6_STRPU|nr:uncharacterized protein LOC115920905 [Strongylocentrotus purpuratus]XP_030833536.1 uncharacterized protein LOC105445475 [Strongylocentrotus purpuratus]|eukprot:XP_011679356.1 PREDICTED: uncharacterized protein LOC105445475 isoform X2 [Strongylocentrotus purpuratus]